MAVESHEHAVSIEVLLLMEASADILAADDLGLPPDHVDWKSAVTVLRRAYDQLKAAEVDRPSVQKAVV